MMRFSCAVRIKELDHALCRLQVGSGDALTPQIVLESPSSAVLQAVNESFGDAFSRMPLF